MFIYWVEADSLILWNDQIPVDWLRSPASQMQEWKKQVFVYIQEYFMKPKKGDSPLTDSIRVNDLEGLYVVL